ALFRLWEHLGVRPAYVAGHSIGEIAAAHAAGILSLSHAARLAVQRGRLMQQLPNGGGMLAVQADQKTVQPLLEAAEGTVALAAVNSSHSVVLSGDEDTLAALQSEFEERGIRTRPLTVSHAFHSPHMQPML
ncbi:acyltransferase domain-containing protein, partial [Streptomyces monomycini]|uniref:acyltransferase domain-containing protein n=1 Tax=Streptomyces monomycini TaxID=371720 RepID=UPI0004AB1EF8